jgi:hypothetical protein
LVIDNVDEALTPFFPEEESLFDLLCHEFPSGWKMITTSRSPLFPYVKDRLLELKPFSKLESQRFCKELQKTEKTDKKNQSSSEVNLFSLFERAEGNPLVLQKMFQNSFQDSQKLVELEWYFRKLFIRYSNAKNLKIFALLTYSEKGLTHDELAEGTGWLRPLIYRQISAMLPLLKFRKVVFSSFIVYFTPTSPNFLKIFLSPKRL